MDTAGWVAVVEDDRLAGQALVRLLAVKGVVGRVLTDASALLASVVDHGAPSVLVLDHDLGDGLTGARVLAEVRARGIDAPALLWSGAPPDMTDASFVALALDPPPGFSKPDVMALADAAAAYARIGST